MPKQISLVKRRQVQMELTINQTRKDGNVVSYFIFVIFRIMTDLIAMEKIVPHPFTLITGSYC